MTLQELQERMGAAVMRPLTASDKTRNHPRDAEFVRPNDRLSALERLEIYNRQYWFRVLDSLAEDFPGLCAIVGRRAFDRLSRAYLAECPSQSFTLRNLGSRLEEWLRRNPQYAGRVPALALDMVRLEWAHVEAFDNGAARVLGPEDLLELGPDFRAALQPYVRLLHLQYPVDNLRIRVNADSEEHGTASNAVSMNRQRGMRHHAVRLTAEEIYLAVHRVDFMVYYRRLAREEFRLLKAIERGVPIGEAIDDAFTESALPPEEISPLLERWFATWAQLGWLCHD
ncbi:MAG: DNA-binding domain-containing protein [Bryobacteraceae bacterium]|jgi:hypothetical protein